MTLEVEYDGTENEISITIDYFESEITINKNSSNGDKPEIYTFEIDNIVNIKTIGADHNFHFRVESNGNSDDSLRDSVEETEEETVSDDVSAEAESETIGDGTSAEVESEIISNDVPIEAEIEIVQDSDPVDNQTSDDGVEAIETDPNSESDQPSVEEIREKDLDFVFLTKNGIRILAVLLRKMELKRDEINVTDVPSSNVSNALKELEESNLICYENNRRLIKPNLEKVSISCLWLYDSQIQKIVNSEFDFRFGRSVQNILHLLYNYPDGLYRDAITIGTSLSKPVFNKAIVTMERYGLIEVTGKRNETIIFPKFSANHVEKDSIISQKPIVVETDLANTEESVADSDADREDLLTSQSPTAVETISDQEVVTGAKSTVAINTAEGFNIKNFESYISIILKGSSDVKLQTLSSRFGVKLRDEGITKLLNAIDKRIAIEVVNVRTGKIVSWEPKHSKGITVYFEGIAFGNLEVRKKTDNLKEEDSEKQEITGDIKIDDLSEETVLKEEAIELTSEDKEGIKKDIKARADNMRMGEPFKNILYILIDNLPSGVKLKDIIEEAENYSMRKAQIKPYLDILTRQGFVRKEVGEYKLLNV
ncbi:MAG: hypothetical protein KAI71_00655 [Candidatus Pacebacteria bacterium]|nr:hypothetical protein [Candidatus Paceibacterota bacterium]